MTSVPDTSAHPYGAEYFSRLSFKGTHTGLDRRAYFAHWLRRFMRTHGISSVSDLGCGDGYYLREVGLPGQSFGLDLSEAALRVHRGTGSAFPVVQASVIHLPWRSGAADLVLLLDVIEHLPNDAALLREVHRVLKPSGYLILSTPNLSSFGRRNKGAGWFAHRDATHVNCHEPEYWTELLRRSGFDLVRAGSDSCWDVPYNIPVPMRLQWLFSVVFTTFTRLSVGFWPWRQGENFFAIARAKG